MFINEVSPTAQTVVYGCRSIPVAPEIRPNGASVGSSVERQRRPGALPERRWRALPVWQRTTALAGFGQLGSESLRFLSCF